MNSPKPIQFTDNQINGLKAGLNQIAQGCVTLIKVLSMSQIPHADKFPDDCNSDSEKRLSELNTKVQTTAAEGEA